MRTLRIKGTGKASRQPDLIVVNFKIVSEDYNYDEALNNLNKRTALLRQDIVKAGFNRDDLKTTNFNINTKYRYEDGQSYFDGYRASHDLKLEFPYNRLLLNQLLKIVSISNANAEFKIFFEVDDKEDFKNELLRNAVENAKKNALVITDAAGVKLGKILNITYDWQEILSRSKLKMEMSEIQNGIDVVPEDVEAGDTVSIEWEIEDYV